MQLYQNQKTFSEFFSSFPKSTENSVYFEKKDGPQRLFLSEIIDSKKRSYVNAQRASCQNTYGQWTC